MGSFGQVPYTRLKSIKFGIYTDEEIKKISVSRITNDQGINELGHLSPGGVYDLRMGPMSMREQDICQTCGQDSTTCRGHCAHIEIPLPVYNPIFYDVLRKLLSIICPTCFRLQVEGHHAILFMYQMKLLRDGYDYQALELQDFVSTIISGNMEADEVTTRSDGKDIIGSEKNFNKINMSRTLEKSVKKYYENLIKDGTCSHRSSTSNVKAIEIQVQKKFIDKCTAKKRCKFCKHPMMKISLQNSRFMKVTRVNTDKTKDKGNEEEEEKDQSSRVVMDAQSYITSEQAQTILQKCWMVEKDLLKSMYPVLSSSDLEYPTNMFFIKTLLVIPPMYRPCNKRDNVTVEHETSVLLKNVVRLSKILEFLMSLMNGTITDLPETLMYIVSEIPGETPAEKVQNVWYQIQGNVDNMYDADLNPVTKVTMKGVRQVIEKKHGLFRQNLMGKRVNFSARSVAAPDPHLAVDEVGVPMDFALSLSYPVPVTPWNVEKLRQLVKNGPEVYPGAVMVEDEEGKKKRLSTTDAKQRNGIASKLLTPPESHVRKVNATKIVHRHLQNGDFVLMNRQPTLHRPSIQAHRARVMPKDRVIRMPYANCKAYNADFDGDELNLHFPQNEIARSEARHLITTHNQYLTPKDGSPLAGLIQDCVVASVNLTVRGNFFSCEDYYQLLYAGLCNRTEKIKTLPPAIVKPKQLWSGKQIISSLLLNIIPNNKARPSFNFKTSVKVDMWQTNESNAWKAGGPPEKKREAMTESDFVMQDGELLSGVIDKSAIGSTSYGLIHICYDLYGGEVASKLLTAINSLCVYYLKWCGHTISVKEFVTPEHISKKRKASLNDLIQRAPSEVSQKLGIPEEDFRDHFECSHMSHNEKDMAAIDAAYTSVLGPTTSEVTRENERGLLRRGLDNRMRMMVDTGAKGSKVNMNQIASLFGSVAVDGKRMPISIAGKFLPSFKAYEPDPCAGGYIPDRFMTGINPQSYFYLCIVGRDSLQHTAVKTADSGYLQRSLIKHLEGISVKYDMTVRNSDDLVLQFNYGEDGLDVTKVPFLRNVDTLDVLVKNYSRLLDDRSLSIAKSVGDKEKEKIDSYTKKLRKWQRKNNRAENDRCTGFLKFCKKNAHTIESRDYSRVTGRSVTSKHLEDMWRDLTSEKKKTYNKNTTKCPDPVKSVFSGTSNLGIITEALDDLINRYYEENYSKQRTHEQKLTREQVATTVHMKALTSMVDPGEAVGALCAQALGEPLTQMTLNTFHFAGKDELNVTLGVPRMIEILRTASPEISTPIMEVPFHAHISRAHAEALRIKLSEVSLAKVLHKIDVTTRLERDKKGRIHRRTKIKFTFIPYREYKHVFSVNPGQVLWFVESHFIPKILLKEIQKSYGKRNKLCSTAANPEKNIQKQDDDNANIDGLDASGETMKAQEEMRVRIDEGSDEEEEEEGQETAQDAGVNSSLRNRKSREQDYSEDENEDVDDDGEIKKDILSEDEGIGEEELNSDEGELAIMADVQSIKKRKKAIRPEEVVYRKESLLAQDSWIVDYDIDREKELWCEVTFVLPISGGNYDIPSIVRQKSERTLIHYVRNIRRVFVVEKEDTLLLRTEGVNILKLFEYVHLLDVNRLYTNNIHQVAKMYGIEAAQRSVIREIRAVQSAYDIKVDYRHLTLLADYFTCEGTYKACSRTALASCLSPLQKMSYEILMQFLKTGILQEEEDHMTSPTANIAVGQPVKLGTNAMQMLSVLKF